MIEQIKISICISVHNTGQYLRRCLDSVVEQSIREKEIILVNNGSTDDSLEIMKIYRHKYPHLIKIFNQEDKGLAQGRQTGVNNAQGEFIAFLDADDFIVKEAYEKMYSCAIENDVDIVECQTRRDGIIVESQYSGMWNAHKVLYDYFELGNLPTMLWMRIYRRKLFEKPVFPDAYTNNEDNFALPCLLHNANEIYFMKEQLHYYSTDNEHAVMENINRKTVENSKIIENRIMTLKAISHVRDYIGKNVIEEGYNKVFKSYIARIGLSFCLYDFESLLVSKRIEIVCTNLDISKNDLNGYFKKYYRDSKKIKFLITLIGLRHTIFIYKKLQK